MFKRVLVANRGEIAVRIIRTLRDLGIESVAIYSDSDCDSLHVALADYAIALNGQDSSDTYLNISKIIACAHESHADAVHPGYGFLAENANFAEALAKTSIKFIGPSPFAIRTMGDKVGARKLMQQSGVPIVPGSKDSLADLAELEELVRQIGFPVILKAAGGGGGRGMRIVHEASELKEAFESCRREAELAFANPAVFCERYLQNPRHIEFQILCDKYGQGVHLFERECSIQRRHQKLFEEAPSHFLNAEQREYYGKIAVKAAQAVQYQGTGTIEFIGEDPDQLYFMEMNTRIQVEHTVTEMITGLDIVAEQIKIAKGQRLTYQQKDLTFRGWSLEARINAEDPTKGFLPYSGRITELKVPSGPHVRIDSHLYQGCVIPPHYDSLLMKLIVWGPTRLEALARMRRCLQELVIKGIPTTIAFHEALLAHKDFIKGDFSTAFLEKEKDYFSKRLHNHAGDLPVELAALLAGLVLQEQAGS